MRLITATDAFFSYTFEEVKPKETLFKPNNVDLVKLSVTVLLLHSIIEKHVPTRWLSLYHFHQRSYHLSISYLRPIRTVLDADDDNPTEFETYTVKTNTVPTPTLTSLASVVSLAEFKFRLSN